VQNVDVNYLRDEIPKATEQLLEGVATSRASFER